MITRRDILIGAGASGLLAPWRGGFAREEPPPEPSARQRQAMAGFADEYLEKFRIPALSVAIAKHGRIVYREAFGLADVDDREPATSDHRFRIASVSKPITSTAIYALIEEGKLGLDDKVFAQDGRLRSYSTGYPSSRLQEVTVHQLLTHTSGGWPNDQSDPMFLDRELGQRELIIQTLAQRPLDFPPGTHWAYSNFGYCLLGRLIEAASGMSYPEYVRQRVLSRSGVTGMRIAGNTRSDREIDEVAYGDHSGQDPYGMNVSRMDSHGGWIATASDLVQFALHVDGFGDAPQILSPRSIQAMTSTVPASASARYASGWNVNSVPNWWHLGSLPGTTAILVRTASGLCWAALANARSPGSDDEIDRVMWKMAKTVPAWQA